MGERQRGFFRRVEEVVGATPEQHTYMLVAGRARQLLRLKGYRFFHEGAKGLLDSGADLYLLYMTLQVQARDRDVSSDVTPDYTLGLDEIIDTFGISYALVGSPAAINVHVIDYWKQSEWVECNLLIPALSLHVGLFNSNTINRAYGVVYDYEWENASAGKIASVMLAHGLDPQDFDHLAS